MTPGNVARPFNLYFFCKDNQFSDVESFPRQKITLSSETQNLILPSLQRPQIAEAENNRR